MLTSMDPFLSIVVDLSPAGVVVSYGGLGSDPDAFRLNMALAMGLTLPAPS